MNKDSTDKKRRRRTCADEWRRDLARRHERRADPAGKALLQLLALLSALLALAPPVSAPAFDLPLLRRRSPHQPPPGYPNGRAAWARERGLEPEPETTPATPTPLLRPRPQPRPWRRLVKDLDSRSERRREQAREQLLQRVPEEARLWLAAEIRAGDRQALRMLGHGADPRTLGERVLAAARVVPPVETTPEPTTTDIDAGLTPGRK